jgi:[ribosomal protein S5]-alanine N-acetyltransferase
MLNLSFDPFPVLETDRLLFRRHVREDAPVLFAYRSSPEIMKFIDRPLATKMDDALELIQKIDDGINSNTLISWAVMSKENNSLAGSVSFHKIYPEHHRAEIGYLFGKEYWGKGFAAECVKVLTEYGFGEMKLHSIEANVNPKNAASMRVLEKNNFVREAYFKENYYWNGKFLDTAIYSLITPYK